MAKLFQPPSPAPKPTRQPLTHPVRKPRTFLSFSPLCGTMHHQPPGQETTPRTQTKHTLSGRLRPHAHPRVKRVAHTANPGNTPQPQTRLIRNPLSKADGPRPLQTSLATETNIRPTSQPSRNAITSPMNPRYPPPFPPTPTPQDPQLDPRHHLTLVSQHPPQPQPLLIPSLYPLSSNISLFPQSEQDHPRKATPQASPPRTLQIMPPARRQTAAGREPSPDGRCIPTRTPKAPPSLHTHRSSHTHTAPINDTYTCLRIKIIELRCRI